ncbi:hypothetical protein QT970_20350 [Microcoleus sp. herbarium8]|uniref:hypothetical protein n=1 Tax=Microcoleus sp. herbarium8 TaxID=3055436 RepID=UPI002FD35659
MLFVIKVYMFFKRSLAFSILSLILVSGCSAPSVQICGLRIAEGEKLPVRTNNIELINTLATIDQADKARREGKVSSFSMNESNDGALLLASSLNLIGIGSDGQNLILRRAKDWESNEALRAQIEPALCRTK